MHEAPAQLGASAEKAQVGKPGLLPVIRTQAERWARESCLALITLEQLLQCGAGPAGEG